MLLTMMLVLAVTSCALELMIAAKVPAWRRLSAKSPLFNLLNSLAISFIMGLAFGGSGLIAMGAGVISTILSVPGYQFLYWNYDSPKAISGGATMLKQYRNNISSQLDKTKELFIDLCKLFYLIGKIITFPFWLPAKISNWFKELTSRTPTTTP
jgi:hypothetical protein